MKTAVLATALLGASAVIGETLEKRASITSVTVKGNAFFKGDERFYIRGVDYQPGGSSKKVDPIADEDLCARDVTLFKELGLNTVRVYHVDNSKNHDKCMKMLADAGIYLVLDVNTPEYSLNRDKVERSYNAVYLQNIFATVEMFAKYDNTLAFFSGNEVINNGENSAVAPYVKAVTRDIRSYLKERKLRQVPVGYSAADIDTNRLEMAEYMNCGSDDERSDFFAFNDYSWCSSSFMESGWDQKVKNFTGYSIPIFLSEYGCNKNKRDFGEVAALYSTKMSAVYSGGLVYEYSEEPSNYGLVDLSKGKTPKKLPDFDALKKAYSKTSDPKGDAGFSKSGDASKCPKKNSPNWEVDGSKSLPEMPEEAKKYLSKGAGKGPGFEGKGSQDSGKDASSTAPPGTDSPSSTSTSTSTKNAAAGLRVPALTIVPVVGLAVAALSTVFGASMIIL